MSTNTIIKTIVIFVVFSVAATVSIYSFRIKLLDVLIEKSTQKQELLGQQLSGVFQNHINTNQDLLALLASLPDIRSGSGEACTQKLQDYSDIISNHMESLGRINSNGVFDCALNTQFLNTDYEIEQDAYTKELAELEHNPILTHSMHSVVDNTDSLYIHLPILDAEGNIAYILAGNLYFSNIYAKFLSNLKLSDKTIVKIIDDNGDILYHSDNSLIGQNFWSASVQDLTGKEATLDTAVKSILNREVDSVALSYSRNDENYNGVIVASDVFPNRRFAIGIFDPTSEVVSSVSDIGVSTILSGVSIMVLTVFALGFGFMYLYITKTKI